MRSRPADDRDEEIAHLPSEVGQLTMDNELLGQKCRQVESRRPCIEEADHLTRLSDLKRQQTACGVVS
jgi:hypothetical protein